MSAKEKTTFECWQNFLACVALHMVLPLLPLLLERWFSGEIAPKSISLTAALYSLAIALSSRHVALLGIGILLGFAFAATFGYLSTDPIPMLRSAHTSSGAAIAFMFGLHIIERFYRHIFKDEEFFEFLKSD